VCKAIYFYYLPGDVAATSWLSAFDAADPALWNVVEFVVSTPAGLEEECDERGV